MLLWLTHWGQNLLWDPRGDCFWRCGAFPFCDFGLPRTGSSSAVYPGSLDSLHSSSGISSSSAWALGLIWNGLGFAKFFSPTIPFPQKYIILVSKILKFLFGLMHENVIKFWNWIKWLAFFCSKKCYHHRTFGSSGALVPLSLTSAIPGFNFLYFLWYMCVHV